MISIPWGWFFLIVGILQMAAAVSIWNRQMFGQMFGIFSASLNIVVLLFTVNAYPFAAFMLFIVDVLVIYGLTVYGGRGLPSGNRIADRTMERKPRC